MRHYQPLNDYEIIHLIQEGDEEVFTLMVEKYSRFIAKKIHKFNLAYDYEDLYQEAILILHKSVITFNADYNKTFTRFFELNLERFLISTIKTIKHRMHTHIAHYPEIREYNHAVKESSAYYYVYLAELRKILTELEYRVYILREIKNNPITAISLELNVPIKTVYNSLHRAKVKIHQYFQG